MTTPATTPTPSSAPRILAAARTHFMAHGFRSVTMDDLARALGISKKTLYAAYPSKPALLEAVLFAKLAEAEAELEAATADCSDFSATLHAILAIIQRQAQELSPSFVRDMARDAPDLFQRVQAQRAIMIDRFFGRLFSAGRAAGLIRRDIPVRVIIEVLLGATQAVVNPIKVTQLGLTPRTAFASVIKLILEGVLIKPTPRKRPA